MRAAGINNCTAGWFIVDGDVFKHCVSTDFRVWSVTRLGWVRRIQAFARSLIYLPKFCYESECNPRVTNCSEQEARIGVLEADDLQEHRRWPERIGPKRGQRSTTTAVTDRAEGTRLEHLQILGWPHGLSVFDLHGRRDVVRHSFKFELRDASARVVLYVLMKRYVPLEQEPPRRTRTA